MISVSLVPVDQRPTALSLLFRDVEEDKRVARIDEILHLASVNELNLNGLLWAKIGDKPVGVGLIDFHSDATAFVWPPVVKHDLSSINESISANTITDAILKDLGRRIDDSGVWIGQCLLEPERSWDREQLSRNGFKHLTDLIVLQRELSSGLPPRSPVDFETVVYDPTENHDRFVHVLEQTFVGTLDCPELNDMRTASEAFASHQLSGEFDPAKWKIFRLNEVDVGLLLMNDHSDQKAWEVVYAGVTPEARGHGHGREILLSGLYEARSSGKELVFLAVDIRNSHARKLYKSLGFIEISVQAVHLRRGKRNRDDD